MAPMLPSACTDVYVDAEWRTRSLYVPVLLVASAAAIASLYGLAGRDVGGPPPDVYAVLAGVQAALLALLLATVPHGGVIVENVGGVTVEATLSVEAGAGAYAALAALALSTAAFTLSVYAVVTKE